MTATPTWVKEGKDRSMQNQWGRRLPMMGLLILGILLVGGTLFTNAQSQQEVNVTIEGYKFLTSQMPLQLHADTIIRVKNLDNVRHDFGSQMFLNTLTHVESDGVVTYGKGIEGAYVDPGQEASFRLTLDQVGRFQFQCSIHPDMKGEILLLIIDAV
jgi:plastocyanin